MLETLSFLVLLGCSVFLGYSGKSTEMGLSILAGALGLAFVNIDKIARFKGAGFEAEMHKVNAVIDTQTEPSPQQEARISNASVIEFIEYQILRSLEVASYTWRYAETVAKIVSRPLNEVDEILNSLAQRDLVKNAEGTGGEIWALSTVGRIAIEQYERKRKENAIRKEEE